MWIDATSGEDELGAVGAIGGGGEEWAPSTGGLGTMSELGAVHIVMWGSLARDVGGIWTCGGFI